MSLEGGQCGEGVVGCRILAVHVDLRINLRDIGTDERAGKRTLAVRMGPGATKVEYMLLLGIALAIPVIGWRVLAWPLAALGALLAMPLAVSPTRRVLGHTDPTELLPALGETARLVALYGVLLGLALALG